MRACFAVSLNMPAVRGVKIWLTYWRGRRWRVAGRFLRLHLLYLRASSPEDRCL